MWTMHDKTHKALKIEGLARSSATRMKVERGDGLWTITKIGYP